MNDKAEQFLPAWVWVIILVQILLVLFFSVGTAISPGDFIPNASELNYVTQLYITRNITVVLGLIVALLLRSHRALLTLLIVRLLTDISDVMTVYALDIEVIKESVPMVAVLLIIPAFFAVVYLLKRA
ncbi:hypothetical protein N9F42_01795 [Pseudomonadales bacterium]|nr:hypothetical protein [Pseudomonadales bacterium]